MAELANDPDFRERAILLKFKVSWQDSAQLTRRERHAVFKVLAEVAEAEKSAIERARKAETTTDSGVILPPGRKMPMKI